MTETLSLFDVPRARRTDPPTSHRAGRKVAQSNDKLIKAVRDATLALGSGTSWAIADAVQEKYGDLWAYDSIRTACARAGLVKREGGESPRGNAAVLYFLPVLAVPVGAIL